MVAELQPQKIMMLLNHIIVAHFRNIVELGLDVFCGYADKHQTKVFDEFIEYLTVEERLKLKEERQQKQISMWYESKTDDFKEKFERLNVNGKYKITDKRLKNIHILIQYQIMIVMIYHYRPEQKDLFLKNQTKVVIVMMIVMKIVIK